MPSVLIAQPTGFCSGVERAVRLARTALDKYGRVWTYGELVHNPDVLRELKKEGIRPVRQLATIKNGALVIRAHGCPPAVLTECRARGIEIVDATCPYVRRVQNVAHRLATEGYYVVVVGEKNHPEVRAILAAAGENASVYRARFGKIPNSKKRLAKIGVVAQTTLDRHRLKEAVATLINFGYTEIRVFDTICAEVTARQAATARLAAQVEAVIVVGGKNSANTTRLAEIVRQQGKPVAHITGPAELKPGYWRRFRRVGVVAGASTPASVVAEVARILRNAGTHK
jgi:(E)-4-hydroxy-3-methyl-but-2-enyl pyrophosphate reductase